MLLLCLTLSSHYLCPFRLDVSGTWDSGHALDHVMVDNMSKLEDVCMVVLSCIVEGRGRECANPHFLSLPWHVTELHMWERAILHQPASQDPHRGEHSASSCVYNLLVLLCNCNKIIYILSNIVCHLRLFSRVLPIVQLSCIYCSISCIDLLLATDLG